MSVKSKEEWASEWVEKIHDNREELKKYIKYAYSNACRFESGNFDLQAVLLMYDGTLLFRFGLSDILESNGLALAVYTKCQFDCTNGGDFNFSDYLTSEENYLYKVWCKVTSKEYTWTGIKEWSPEVYKRVGRQHRLALLEKFDPDAEIDKTLMWLKEKDDEDTPTGKIIEGDALEKSEPVPQEGFNAFWNLFRIHGGNWYMHLTHPGTGEFGEMDGYDMAFEILQSFLYCYDPVPLKYRAMVYSYLERDNLWDQKTRDKVLEGCTYSELSFILFYPLNLIYLQHYNTKRFQGYMWDYPIYEKEPLSPEVSEDREEDNGETLDDVFEKDVPF